MIKEQLPDVVMLDLRMPHMDGLDVLMEVNKSKLPGKVIIMTTFDSEEDVATRDEGGGPRVLAKRFLSRGLDAIRRVSLGETYLPARIVQKVAEGMPKPELSPREAEVLKWVAAGKSNKEIGPSFSSPRNSQNPCEKPIGKTRCGRTYRCNPGGRPPKLGQAQLT